MSSTFPLLKDIKDALIAEFDGFVLRAPAPDGKPTSPGGKEFYRPPGIYIGGLDIQYGDKPVDRKNSVLLEESALKAHEKLVPWIIVRPIDSETVDKKYAEIGIVYTIYVGKTDREAGIHDLMNVSDRIIAALYADRYWGDNGWVQTPPIRMINGTGKAGSIYESGLQGNGPYFGGAVVTQFEAMMPGKNPFEVM